MKTRLIPFAASLVLLSANLLHAESDATKTPAAETPAPASKPDEPKPDADKPATDKPAANPLSGATATAPAPAAPVPGAPANESEKTGYSLGVDIARQLLTQYDGLEIDKPLFLQGIQDVIAKNDLKMKDEEMAATLDAFGQKLMEKKMKEQAASAPAAPAADPEAATKAIEEGRKFLEENSRKEGVVTLPSGLQYKIIKEAKGDMPKDTDTVVVHYRGTLISGAEFDSSYSRGTPATFPVGEVIKGWTEVLQLMPVGSKWQVFIPSALAYGERGAGGIIGPNQTLIFDVELLEIKK